MRVRPLKDLLEQADRYLGTGQVKSASVTGGANDEIASLAGSLLSASEVLEAGAVKVASGEHSEADAILAMNRVHAGLQIEELKKMASLRKAALAEGYSEEQVEEVLEKVAAKGVHANLATLVALEGAVALPTNKDANSLQKKLKPARSIKDYARRRDATEALGE